MKKPKLNRPPNLPPLNLSEKAVRQHYESSSPYNNYMNYLQSPAVQRLPRGNYSSAHRSPRNYSPMRRSPQKSPYDFLPRKSNKYSKAKEVDPDFDFDLSDINFDFEPTKPQRLSYVPPQNNKERDIIYDIFGDDDTGGPTRSPMRSPYGSPMRSPYGSPMRSPYGSPMRSPYGSRYGSPIRSSYGSPHRKKPAYRRPSKYGSRRKSSSRRR